MTDKIQEEYHIYIMKLDILAMKSGKIEKEWRDFIKDNKEDCSHQYIKTSSYEHDNGYGKQTKIEYEYCQICRKEKHYGNWQN